MDLQHIIIYENNDVLVVNKPAGMVVYPPSQTRSVLVGEPTLVDWLVKKYPEIKNVGDPSTSSGQENLRPGIVHRLDKDTSGIMIIAKNQPTFEYLKKQFQERKIKKTYIALVVGNLKQQKGTIDLPIGRSAKSPLQRIAGKPHTRRFASVRGKLREAITEYKILEKFPGYTLVEVYPKTGRTHQIRVHFKAIGHPIVCDKLYSKNPICSYGLSRQFLHAHSLELTLSDGSRSRFEADLPDNLQKVLRELREIKKYDRN